MTSTLSLADPSLVFNTHSDYKWPLLRVSWQLATLITTRSNKAFLSFWKKPFSHKRIDRIKYIRTRYGANSPFWPDLEDKRVLAQYRYSVQHTVTLCVTSYHRVSPSIWPTETVTSGSSLVGFIQICAPILNPLRGSKAAHILVRPERAW